MVPNSSKYGGLTENVLLGYSPNTLSSFQGRSSDVDFSDVFGGPPRRSSTQEAYYSERSSSDYLGNDDDEQVEGSRSSSWTGLREKPVFGEQVGVRIRHTSGDFFDDIFKGEQSASSCSQSPRNKARRNAFSSAPGSRVMSPSRPLPPAVESLPTPAKLSLPGRVTNTDFTVSLSINKGPFNPSPSRFNQTTQNQDGSGRASYQSSALSRHDSTDVTDSAKATECSKDSANFHFSIYKWANKGVPLIASLRKRSQVSADTTQLETCGNTKERVQKISENQQVEILVDSFPSARSDRMSSAAQVKHAEQTKDSNVHLNADQLKSKDKIHAEEEPKSTLLTKTQILDDIIRTTSSGLEYAKQMPYGSVKSPRAVHSEPNKSTTKIRKSYLRPLRSFLTENRTDEETVSVKKRSKERKVKAKKDLSSENEVSNDQKGPTQEHEPFIGRRDLHKSDSPGKVKGFVKIFNQGPPSKASSNDLDRNYSRKWKDTTMFEVDREISSLSTRTNDEMQTSYVNWEESLAETSEVVDENVLNSAKEQFKASNADGASKAVPPIPPNAPNVESRRASPPVMNPTTDEDILNTEMLEDIDINSVFQPQEPNKEYEIKVLQWSKGKEGNIRALLSTLQYVLWPDSGWKPVPLMDIIEANAVKRAYQRALLRLHPDKLQQKGAAPHHKFIAEKVFDILQEAWDQFNSLGSL